MAAVGGAAGTAPARSLPVWKTSAFCGEFADIALGVCEIEDGSLGPSVRVFGTALQRALTSADFNFPGLPADTLAALQG